MNSQYIEVSKAFDLQEDETVEALARKICMAFEELCRKNDWGWMHVCGIYMDSIIAYKYQKDQYLKFEFERESEDMIRFGEPQPVRMVFVPMDSMEKSMGGETVKFDRASFGLFSNII